MGRSPGSHIVSRSIRPTTSFLPMPVMVVGADSDIGRRIIDRFLDPRREVRAFVTDPGVAEDLKRAGAKVALGDVSDDSHLAGACLNCFSAILVADAASDSRLRSFASDRAAVLDSWAKAVASAGIQRVIWVTESGEATPPCPVQEVTVVDRSDPDLVEEVFRLDAAASLE